MSEVPSAQEMSNLKGEEWRLLLRLVLSQRLEINAIETALTTSRVLTEGQIKEIRKQASQAATSWSSDDSDDVLALIKIHSSPEATMKVPPIREDGR